MGESPERDGGKVAYMYDNDVDLDVCEEPRKNIFHLICNHILLGNAFYDPPSCFGACQIQFFASAHLSVTRLSRLTSSF